MNINERIVNPLHGLQSRFEQPEDAVLKYQIKWGLMVGTAQVTTSTWTLLAGDATLSDTSSDGQTTSVFITGTASENTIENTVVLDNGETDQRIIKLKILDNYLPYMSEDYHNCF